MSENRTAHTSWEPEPWDYDLMSRSGPSDWMAANNHRAVVCVNALEGIADPSVVPEMVQALRQAFAVLSEPGMMEVDDWKGWMKVTLAKIHGCLIRIDGGE